MRFTFSGFALPLLVVPASAQVVSPDAGCIQGDRVKDFSGQTLTLQVVAE